jgi:hypothetical protein
MTPESRSSPLPDNDSLTYVSKEMRIRGDRLGTERAFHVKGINEGSHEGASTEDWFIRNSVIREFSFQLWSVNQRTTEAEEVTDS